MSAAFHAPLPGTLFAIEEIQKDFILTDHLGNDYINEALTSWFLTSLV